MGKRTNEKIDHPVPSPSGPVPSAERLRELNEKLTLATLEAHEQAEESASRYRTLVDGLDAIVWEADADPWRFTFVSERALTLLGYPLERWYAEPNLWLDIIHPEDREATRLACRNAAAVPQDFRLEYRMVALDGHIVHMAMIARPGPRSAPRIHFTGLLIDVGDAVRAQALQKLVAEQTKELLTKQDNLRALARELTLAEHRVRTRLASELHDHLGQLLALGRMKLGQARQADSVPPRCLQNIERTQEILDECLTYTRTLVADLSPPVLQEFGLPAALQWLGRQMRRYELLVEVQIPTSFEGRISEEQGVLLFQSVRELLINIAKHAKTGRATVILECETDRLQIKVRDQGQGFDVSSALATDTGTTKFGLFSIRERMKALGGDFEITSVYGTGSTATLTLPLGSPGLRTQSVQSGEPIEGRHRETSAPGTSSSLADRNRAAIHVLLVDDHAMIRQGLRMVVDAYAHLQVVGEACNGVEAIEAARQLKPDVVVMDINMPIMDGIEATRNIMENFPGMAVVGLSMHIDADVTEKMNQAGVCAYVAKESAAETLCHAIEHAASQTNKSATLPGPA